MVFLVAFSRARPPASLPGDMLENLNMSSTAAGITLVMVLLARCLFSRAWRMNAHSVTWDSGASERELAYSMYCLAYTLYVLHVLSGA